MVSLVVHLYVQLISEGWRPELDGASGLNFKAQGENFTVKISPNNTTLRFTLPIDKVRDDFLREKFKAATIASSFNDARVVPRDGEIVVEIECEYSSGRATPIKSIVSKSFRARERYKSALRELVYDRF